jgi:cephalosporin-C deacetylase-like acetyl esterase
MKIKNWLLLLIVFFVVFFNAAVELHAQDGNKNSIPSLSVEIEVDDEDGIILNDNSAPVFVVIANNTSQLLELDIEWEIATDNHKPLFKTIVPAKLEANDKVKSYCPLFQFQNPGFFQFKTTVGLNPIEGFSDKMTIGIEPEKISAPIDAEDDFEWFWENAIQEQKSIKPNYKISLIERDEHFKTELFEVEIESLAGLTVRGWLEIPKKKGKYPALLRVPGYTENLTPIDQYDDLIVFSFNTRDHGNSDNTGPRNWDMWVRGMHDKNEFYYRNIILDCLMALDYLVGREDVDTSRIAVWGGSQGGGLSFTTAALDSRISLCIADIPFLCEYPGYFEITHWDEVDNWFAENPDQTWSSMLKTLSYFDTKNMVHRISCPVWMGIGLQDDVCPPSTSFVSYNYIQGDKEYSVYKEAKHWQPDEHYEKRFKHIRDFFQMDADN